MICCSQTAHVDPIIALETCRSQGFSIIYIVRPAFSLGKRRWIELILYTTEPVFDELQAIDMAFSPSDSRPAGQGHSMAIWLVLHRPYPARLSSP